MRPITRAKTAPALTPSRPGSARGIAGGALQHGGGERETDPHHQGRQGAGQAQGMDYHGELFIGQEGGIAHQETGDLAATIDTGTGGQ